MRVSLADVLQEYQASGRTITGLAKKSGVKRARIYQLIDSDKGRGKPTFPSIVTLGLLAQGMGMSLLTLLVSAGYIPDEQGEEAFCLDPQNSKYVKVAADMKRRGIPIEAVEQFLHIAEQFEMKRGRREE